MIYGLIVAAASSHCGKTTVSLGLIAALRQRRLTVAAAKCGPDYLDPRFLEAASGRPAINLDPWAMGAGVRDRLARHAEGADIVVVEGVMGLYDGGTGGIGSTASLAALLGLPVVLVVGGSGLAQSAAAIAKGFAHMADGFAVAGAIVNHVASDRHADLIREGFARSSVPLLGLVRRDHAVALPSRHLGLVQAEEHADLQAKIARAAALVEQGCDVDALLPPPLRGRAGEGGEPHAESDSPSPGGGGKGRGRAYHPSPLPDSPPQGGREGVAPLGRRIAVARDLAFAFSYPHLLGDWRDQGADIRFFSPLADDAPDPAADAVFLPGGYPELYAGRLAAAGDFRAGMAAAAERGALIYGECGGYMVLGDELVDAEGRAHAMLGLLPLRTSFAARRLHLGYRRLRPRGGVPWTGPLAAHEFHFATIAHEGKAERLFDALSPDGAPLGPIGLWRHRIMGSFAHVIDRLPL